MKYLSLFLMLVIFASAAYAQTPNKYDEPMEIPQKQASQLKVLNSSQNFFDQKAILSILQQAYEWASGNVNEGWKDGADKSGSGVRGNAQTIADFKQQIAFWVNILDKPGVTDPAEIAALNMGESAYFTNRYGSDEGDVHTDSGTAHTTSGQNYDGVKGWGHADKYAHDDDLNVPPGNKKELGYYFGRGNTTWGDEGVSEEDATKHLQISFIAEQTEYVFYARATQTPLVLDMDADGKLDASNGQWRPHEYQSKKLVSFDMNGDGFIEKVEWVGPNDGLLVQYDGGEITGKNLFGSEGGRYTNGFEKLSILDANKDNKLTGDELSTLSVWQDKNSNAKVDAGEISSVASLGITEIKITHTNFVGSFIQNGERRNIWDWYPCTFEVKRTK
jgi:hypothetical protein